MIRERALKLGKSAPLVGVLSEPPPDAPSDGKPGVLLLNSGILHRVGACRLHVRLARRLAEQGHSVIRFDFSGIGDSAVRRDDLAFEESAIVEIREALDQLERTRGLMEFVPMGLCSGADMAFEVAKVDDRVTGMALLDLWAYRTPGYYLRRFGPKLLNLPAWINAARVRARDFREAAQQAPDYLDLPTYVREYPPKAQSRTDLEALSKRGVRMLTIFSNGQPDDYNYEGQFRASFRSVALGPLLQEHFIPGSNHIFTDLSHQKWIIETITEWMS